MTELVQIASAVLVALGVIRGWELFVTVVDA